MSDVVEEIYSPASAEVLCAMALQLGQSAELLNNLAAGGGVTLDVSTTPPRLAFFSAEQIRWAATGGEEGHR